MLKSKDFLMTADQRNDALVCEKATGVWRPMRIEDLYELVEDMELSSAIPLEIREQFDVARMAFIYSWFEYRLVTLAERESYAVLEMALRDRIRRSGGDPTGAHGLRALHKKALSVGCYQKKDFEMPSPFTSGETISQFELIRLLRNDLAHGSTRLLPDGSLQMIRLCFEIINKLFVAESKKDAA